MEPPLLAPGEAAGSEHDVLLRLRAIAYTVKEVDHLRVAQGPAGRARISQPGGQEAPNLLDEAGVEHPGDTGLDPRIQDVARQVEADAQVRHERRTGGWQLCGERLPRDLAHLERPYDPTTVGGQDVPGSLGVPQGQDGVQPLRADLSQHRPPSRPDLRITAREPEIVKQGPDVEP